MGLYYLLSFFVEDKINILIFVYLSILVYSIFNQFHLLENFTNKKDTNKLRNSNKNDNTVLSDNTKKFVINDISERLIKKYIEKLKKENPNSVYTRKVKVLDIIPIKSEISRSKLNLVKKNKTLLNKPIIITDDNFIIDGHHRWYAMRSNIQNSDIYSNNETDFITCIIIKSDITSFINKINDYKLDYNEKELNNFKIDHSKLKKAKKSIELIKKNIKIIEDYNNELYKLNII